VVVAVELEATWEIKLVVLVVLVVAVLVVLMVLELLLVQQIQGAVAVEPLTLEQEVLLELAAPVS
jgi:hypothetical protein